MKNKILGFTLIEVLVALLIIAMVATGAMKAIGNFADQRHMLKQRRTGHLIAWNVLAEQYQINKGWIDGRSYSQQLDGKSAMLNNDWEWELTKEDTLADNLYRYEAVVYPAGSKSADENATPAASLAVFLMEQR